MDVGSRYSYLGCMVRSVRLLLSPCPYKALGIFWDKIRVSLPPISTRGTPVKANTLMYKATMEGGTEIYPAARLVNASVIA